MDRAGRNGTLMDADSNADDREFFIPSGNVGVGQPAHGASSDSRGVGRRLSRPPLAITALSHLYD
ncbi:MAG: hypothetical protein R6X18_13675 [Chloroflexota bacterium]